MKERVDPWHRPLERLSAMYDEFIREPSNKLCYHGLVNAATQLHMFANGSDVKVPITSAAGCGMTDKTLHDDWSEM